MVIIGGVIENIKFCNDFLLCDMEIMECCILEDVFFILWLVDGCVKINIFKDYLVFLKVDLVC